MQGQSGKTLIGWALCAVLLVVVLLPNAYLLRPAGIVAHSFWSAPWMFLLEWREVIRQATPLMAVVVFEGLLLALTGRPWLWLLLHLPFLFWLPAELFYLHHYGNPTSAHILAIIGETNHDEISGYLGRGSWAWLAAAALWLLALLLVLRFFWRDVAAWRHRTRWWTIAGFGFSLAVALMLYKRVSDAVVRDDIHDSSYCRGEFCGYSDLSLIAYLFIDSYPIGLPIRLYDYHAQQRMLMHYAVSLRNAGPLLARDPALADRAETYVVVIGESARADHWQLFGYPRETTPRLAKRTDLLAFGDAVSVTAATRTSVPILLSGATIADVAEFRFLPPWLNAFKAAGFRVAWLSTQLPIGLHDTTVGIYAQLADDVEFLNSGTSESIGGYDAVLIDALDRQLRMPRRKKLIIVHMLGSHAPYQRRYPDAFEFFRPAPGKRESIGISDRDDAEKIVNAYDNSVRYTDFVLDELIGRLQAAPGMTGLWYVSDHGQTLAADGCGNSGNGFYSRYNFHVPLLFWASPAYTAVLGAKIDGARLHERQPVYAGDFASSVLDAAGFVLGDEQSSHSVMRAGYMAQQRQITIDGHSSVSYDRSFITSSCIAVKSP